MSKRVKITFESVNAGNYTIIPKHLIAETNARVKVAMKKFNTQNKPKMFSEQVDPNAIYGSCIHGENLVRCAICNGKDTVPSLSFKENDPRYCYFIENEKGEWLVDRFDETRLTTDPMKAMRFSGCNGKAIAEVFIGLTQANGKLHGFKVTEHEFVQPKK